MAELSPAANAVWEAFNQDEAGVFVDYGDKLAAALRAVANQDETLFDVEDEMVPAVRAVRTDRLLAIASELDGLYD